MGSFLEFFEGSPVFDAIHPPVEGALIGLPIVGVGLSNKGADLHDREGGGLGLLQQL